MSAEEIQKRLTSLRKDYEEATALIEKLSDSTAKMITALYRAQIGTTLAVYGALLQTDKRLKILEAKA